MVKERREDCVEREELRDEVETDDAGVEEPVPDLWLGVDNDPDEEPDLLCCRSV
jgi:hypothetical protein